MKKLFITLLAFCALSASAQSFRVFYYGDVVAENDTVNVDVEMEDEVNMYFGFANVSDNNLFATVQKQVITSAPNSTSTFCVAGSCCETQSVEFEMLASDTILDSDEKALHVIYNTTESGTTLLKFTFQNSDVASDKFSFYVRFAEPVGIRTNETPVQLVASPNPASSRVAIAYSVSGSSNDYLVVKNLLGVEMYRAKADASGKQVLDVSSFKPGVYFYGLERDGRILNAKKLLVK